MDRALIAIGPSIQLDHGRATPTQSRGARAEDTSKWPGSLSLGLPSGSCVQFGERVQKESSNGVIERDADWPNREESSALQEKEGRFRAFWLGAPSAGAFGRWEETAATGVLHASLVEAATGQLVVDFSPPSQGRKPAALVVELPGFCRLDSSCAHPTASPWSVPQQRIDGLLLVLPVHESGSLHVAFECPVIRGGQAHAVACREAGGPVGDEPPALSPELPDDDDITLLDPPPSTGRFPGDDGLSLDNHVFLQRWYDLATYAFLSEEYVSRHLQAASEHGTASVKQLPSDVEELLAGLDPMCMPHRARLLALHWVVLVLLRQDGALAGLGGLLRRFVSAAPQGTPLDFHGP